MRTLACLTLGCLLGACTIGSRVETGRDAATSLVDGSADQGDAGRADTGSTPGPDASGRTPDVGGWNGFFPPGAPWYQDISKAKTDSESDQVVNGLAAAGGWGNGDVFQIDFSIEVLQANGATPMQDFAKTGDWFDPDCDSGPMPVPAGGAIEGETGYACLGDGDCHLLVAQRSAMKLFEMWRADIRGSTFNGGCLVVWDMSKVYPASGRGDGCTSADAAGYPITPLLFNADEVKAGAVEHAIRFILPNARIRHGVYLHPATHSTGPTAGGAGTPPYGARLRLRPDFPLADLPNDGARTVAQALQKYGMFLADGGNIALTAQSDRFTTAKWSGLLGPRDLDKIKVTDFAMIDGGARMPYPVDCVRNP